jgi:hypothetical protein
VNNGYCAYAFNYGQTLPLTGIDATTSPRRPGSWPMK